MKRLRFGVVTWVTFALAMVAFVRVSLQSLIPPGRPNRLINSAGEYLQRAAHQQVDWAPMSEDPEKTFSLARRQGKPILLVIGASWSKLARQADLLGFSNPEVASLIDRNFFAVRVDVSQQPRWQSTYLPISRVKQPFVSGFQAWILDTQGRLLGLIGSTKPDKVTDYNYYLQSLVAGKGAFGEAALRDVLPAISEEEDKDLSNISEPTGGGLPNFLNYAAELISEPKTRFGAFTEGGVIQLPPLAWLFELRMGQVAAMQASLDPFLFSPMNDILRGGFYRTRYLGPRPSIDLDQPTITNAQMAVVLAEAYLDTSDPMYRAMALNTFDMLMRDLTENGLFVSCRIGDELENDRSASVSFSPLRMRRVLGGPYSDWARANLGLLVAPNPQMLPYPVSRKAFWDPFLPTVLQRLRDDPHRPAKTAGAACLDVNGSTAACLIRCARLLGDSGRLESILNVADRLDPFRTAGGDVVHFQQSATPGTYLGDYLAYSDACLQSYLATGRVPVFETGLSVLQRATELYKYRGDNSAPSQPGCYLTSPFNASTVVPKSANVPEIVDDVRESCMAQMIRLLCDYGKLLAPADGGSDLLKKASDSVGYFANLQVPSSPRMAGYFLAAADYADPQCAFSVGPDSQALADQLSRLRPNRLVAPVEGPIRRDLEKRKPGIYVVSGGVVAGPYTVEQAAKLMPQNLEVGSG